MDEMQKPSGGITIGGDTITHPSPAAPMQAPATQQMGMGQMLIWVVVAIVFFALLFAWFANHNRLLDIHADVRLRGSEAGYMQKQLNDMQFDGRQNFQNQINWRLDELRFGQPYGNHTQALPARFPFYGSQNVGSTFTSSNAVDGSVGNLGAGPF